MSDDFKTTYDGRGDLSISGGRVRNLHADIRLLSGGGPSIVTFLGGSGLNVVVTGLPGAIAVHNGVWRRRSKTSWTAGALTLTIYETGADIRDGTGEQIAILASGGPDGGHGATDYGALTYNDSSGWTATVALESNAPGTLPSVDLTVSAGTLPAGELGYDGGADFSWSATISEVTLEIVLDTDGTAALSDGTDIVARRAAGDPGDPTGEYVATLYGMRTYNAASDPEVIPAATPDGDPAEHDADEPVALDPTTEDDADVEIPTDDTPTPTDDTPTPDEVFGVLQLIYSWPATPDLDDKTTFLGVSVGYGYGYEQPYLYHSGDATGEAESETVQVDLHNAYANEAIGETAEVQCHADWFPPDVTSPATLTVRYSLNGATREQIYTLQPGNTRPSMTLQTVIKVAARNPDVVIVSQPFTVTVALRKQNPPAGVIYLAVTESLGVLSAVSRPTFGSGLPSNSGDTYNVPLAESDGAGNVLPVWQGLWWRDGGSPFVEISEEDYLALDPPAETYYDVILP